jgi:transforming growth factor-beta-induced protein
MFNRTKKNLIVMAVFGLLVGGFIANPNISHAHGEKILKETVDNRKERRNVKPDTHSKEEMKNAKSNIIETAEATQELSTFVVLVQKAGLEKTLSRGSYTVFAPSNEAFSKISDAQMKVIMEDKDLLTSILNYHVLPTVSHSRTISGMNNSGTMLPGQSLVFHTEGRNAFINESTQVTKGDIFAKNGVVHIIDNVLIPSLSDADNDKNIYDVISSSENHTILKSAIDSSGLKKALSNSDLEITFFAPTNFAFDALPEGTLDSLLNDSDALTQILLNHVVDGKVASTQAVRLTSATTLQGSNVTIRSNRNGLHIGNSRILQSDISAGSSVVHVIDTVLLPTTTVSSTK